MNTHLSRIAALFLAGASAAPALAQPGLPCEFSAANTQLSPLYSYFGGVNGFGGWVSATTIHSGYSMYIWANFQHDNLFRIAGFAIGNLAIARPALATAPNADTFSITVQSPAQGRLAMLITVREDDNNDGIIDPAGDDDEWETAPLMLLPGTNVYNLPLNAFSDANPGNGNDARNFTTTNRMGFILTFESRATFPGGIIETPIAMRIDHAGFYPGPQTIPTPCGTADFNNDGDTGTDQDIEAFFACLGGHCCPSCGSADFNGDGDTGTDLDIESFFRVLGGGTC